MRLTFEIFIRNERKTAEYHSISFIDMGIKYFFQFKCVEIKLALLGFSFIIAIGI